jgi:hypothetical protein
MSRETEPKRARYPKKPSADARPRRFVGGGALLALMGVGLVGTGDSDIGAALAIIGVGALIYGIHTFGRLGPSEAAPPAEPR